MLGRVRRLKYEGRVVVYLNSKKIKTFYKA